MKTIIETIVRRHKNDIRYHETHIRKLYEELDSLNEHEFEYKNYLVSIIKDEIAEHTYEITRIHRRLNWLEEFKNDFSRCCYKPIYTKRIQSPY